MQKSQIDFARRSRSLSSVVQQYTRLKRASGGWMGRCLFHHERTPSMHISDDRGRYRCFGCGKSGDVFDFLMEVQCISFPDAVQQLSSGYIETAHPELPDRIERRREIQSEDDQRRIAHAHALWLKREPIKGTVAERYLVETRGIKAPIPDMLGFVPYAYCSPLQEETNALIAPLQDRHGHVTAVQQIFLSRETDDAWRGPEGRRIKRTLGAMRDGCVRLSMPDRTLGLAGSVEDALAASWLYSLPVWATCGEARLSRVWIPEEVTDLVIFADADDPGMKAAIEAKTKYGRHRHVTIMLPNQDVKDFAGLVEARA